MACQVHKLEVEQMGETWVHLQPSSVHGQIGESEERIEREMVGDAGSRGRERKEEGKSAANQGGHGLCAWAGQTVRGTTH